MVEHAGGNGRPRKIKGDASRILRQYLCRDSLISLRTLKIKLAKKNVDVSSSTIQRHLINHGYKKDLPLATPMLTNLQKENCVKWAQERLNDNWKRTVFSDKTAFCIFRNTVKR
ncbi:hypothetical protein G9A89_017295 [Geosiphon pyriformis]|nr:hypothetical protein G9A89_017295 [Geosiphon pyriformis]